MINVPVNIGQTYSIKFWCDKGGNKRNKLNNVIDFEMQKNRKWNKMYSISL